MKISSKTLLFTSLLFSVILTKNSYAQEANRATPVNNGNLEQLVTEKRKINQSLTTNDRYKIQIFSGDSENARKTLQDFKRENKKYDATIVFSTPSYKVWVGNYKNKIDAERHLTELQKKYPTAFLIKPSK